MHIQSLMFFKFSNFVCFQIDVVHHFVFYVVNDRLLMALKIPSFLCYENRQFSLADACHVLLTRTHLLGIVG